MAVDEEDLHFPTAPVIPDHAYDFPPGAHVGHAAALNVPCSVGPAGFLLDRTDAPGTFEPDRNLIEREPAIEPGRQMEAGTEYDPATRARLAPLFR